MDRTYLCPHCGATLNPNVKIVLIAKLDKREGMILLDPEPGNYKVIIPNELTFQTGDLLSLYCPVCRFALQSAADTKLAEIHYRLPTGGTGKVAFSRVFGERATYVITPDQGVETYGEHADRYPANYFGAGKDLE